MLVACCSCSVENFLAVLNFAFFFQKRNKGPTMKELKQRWQRQAFAFYLSNLFNIVLFQNITRYMPPTNTYDMTERTRRAEDLDWNAVLFVGLEHCMRSLFFVEKGGRRVSDEFCLKDYRTIYFVQPSFNCDVKLDSLHISILYISSLSLSLNYLVPS